MKTNFSYYIYIYIYICVCVCVCVCVCSMITFATTENKVFFHVCGNIIFICHVSLHKQIPICNEETARSVKHCTYL
jgi:uncharacterized membrane protein